MKNIYLTLPAALVLLILAFSSFYVVDEGDRGVIVSLGQVEGTAGPGLHFKLPLITHVSTITVRERVSPFENLEAYTFDQQIATIEGLNITYRIPADRVEEVYRRFGTAGSVVDFYIGRRVNAELERVFGGYTAERSIRERAQLSADVATALRRVPADAPIEILTVEVSSIAYPQAYNERINERMSAEVEVARLAQEALQAEQRGAALHFNADAQAYSVTAAATAEANAIRLRGEAEADAIRARSQALAENPSYAELVRAERWDGVLPGTMVPGSTIPFLNVNH